MTFFAAEGGRDFLSLKRFEKGFLGFLARARPGQAFDGVVRDEINFRMKTLRQRCEWFYLVQRIVDAGDQNIFEREHAPFFLLVVLASRGELFQRVSAIYGHEFVADVIRGAVKRNRETKLERFIGESANLWDQAAGRDRDFAGT